MNIESLTSGQSFTMADFPNMTMTAYVVRTGGGMTEVTYKVVGKENAKFDRMVKPALSTVYPV